ncbi:CARKD [Lepeophtheirus salmonis]|uniref:ATP-dependent (S)-NAD(P)H-hydrate dehydratase n=1 Tax=Lepeophtheirus salmonis TaxID=72036 RepID=A0A7R8HAW3_LEPSM|nr:CARKD [Lepeophtheirus salmonis]CAF2965030.1 CARKD [Lepeophtheirus salmonis]
MTSENPRQLELVQVVKKVVPQLSNALRKGQCGRIGVFGGCVIYTGAPYFSGISALKCGADLVHIICEKEAGQVIKSYSPELIVHPILDTEYALEEIDKWLPSFHGVILGPGLGRNQSMSARISLIIERVKALSIPLVIDADGLWHITNSPGVIKGYKKAVLTPNAVEFSRLVKSVLKRDVTPNVRPDPVLVGEVARALGGITLVHKGEIDIITDGTLRKCALMTAVHDDAEDREIYCLAL